MEMKTKEQAEDFLNTAILISETTKMLNERFNNIGLVRSNKKEIKIDYGIEKLSILLKIPPTITDREDTEILTDTFIIYKGYKITEISLKGE